MIPSRLGPAIRVLLLSVASGLLVSERSAVAAEAEDPRWYELRIDGEVCGWSRIRESIDPEGGRRTEEDVSLRLRRGGEETLIRTAQVETVDSGGRLVEMSRLDRQGGVVFETTWRFGGETVLERRIGGDRVETRTHPAPVGDWIPASRLLERADAEVPVGEARVFHVVGPATGLEVVTRRVVAPASPGGPPAGRRWEIHESDAPVVEVLVDEAGRLVRTRTPLGPGLGDLEMVRVERIRDEVMFDAGFDLDGRGAIVPSIGRSVGRPDRGTGLRMRLRVEDGVPPTLPEVGVQRVRRDGDLLTVDVDLDRGTPLAGDPRRWLARTSTLEIDDAEVVRFARRAAASADDDGNKAARLRSAVHRHIRVKSHTVGYAGAAQTVRSREGDCTEHAVLLAAALRVHGVPSRLVTGLVWVPRPGSERGEFVWHMWVQAGIDGVWRDLDPTLDEPVDRHPAYIAVSVSDGSEVEDRRDRTAILELFGRGLEIDVVDRGGVDRIEADP